MKKIHLSKNLIIAAITILAGILIMDSLLVNIYSRSSVNDQYSNSMNKLDVAASRLSDNQVDAQQNADVYDNFNTGRAMTLAYYLDNNPKETQLQWLVKECHLDEFYLVNADGELISSYGDAWEKYPTQLKAVLQDQKPQTIDNVRYYAGMMNNGSTLVIGRRYTDEYNSLLELQTPAKSLSSIVVGESGYIEDVSIDDGTIIYTKDNLQIGKKAADYGVDILKYEDGFSGKADLNGESYYIVTKKVEGNLLLAIVPWNEIVSNYKDIEMLNMILVSLTMLFLLIYAELIRRELARKKPLPEDYLQLGKHLYLNKNILFRMRNIIIIGILGVFLLTYFVHTLSPLSHQGIKNELKVNAVSELLDQNEDRIERLKEQYTKEYTERAQNISYLIYKDPTLASSDSMKVFADRGGLDEVYLFDAQGHVVSSSKPRLNYSLSTNENDPSYAFWKVINGYQDSLAQISGDGSSDEYAQYIGVARQDSLGMVEIKLSSSVMAKRLQATKLSYILSHIAVVNNGFLFAVNTDSMNFDYMPAEKLVGHSALDYGMKESAFLDGYEGFQTISGTQYLLDGVLRGDDYIYCAVPVNSIYSSRTSTTVWTTLICTLMILAITMTLVLSSEPIAQEPGAAEEKEKNSDSAFFRHSTMDGRKRLIQSATSRYETHIYWNDRTPEQKLYSIVSWVMTVISIILVINIVTVEHSSAHSVLGYILNQKWEKGINVFSLTFVFLTMLKVIVLTWAVRKGLLYVLKKFGARSETVGHLLDSSLKYAAVIGGIFYCLNAIGLDSISLLASASIFGLMLSFGAQALIEDVLAGISIVFEGEFRVGDIVTIENWRGTVVEIGIRTTKIMSGGHDIKIFNNSEIKQVINMTKLYSTAIVELGIDYRESLERVESILKKELPRIREHIPAIMEGPFYEGVTKLSEESVVIRIFAECHEIDRTQVVRDLNRELKLCIDRNHILVPAVQKNDGEDTAATAATNEDKKNASMFIKEQREASKEMSETHDE